MLGSIDERRKKISPNSLLNVSKQDSIVAALEKALGGCCPGKPREVGYENENTIISDGYYGWGLGKTRTTLL